MKKVFLILMAVLPLLCFTSCSDDENEPKFDYDTSMIYGTWVIQEIEIDGTWIEWRLDKTSATFNPDGTYYGKGEYGNGSGTYVADGKTITCYVDGMEYLKYDIIDLTDGFCELRMYTSYGDAESNIRCVKE